MGFIEQKALVTNTALRSKIQMAVIAEAGAVLADSGRSSEHGYCKYLLLYPNSEAWLDSWMYYAATITGVELATDVQISTNVASKFLTFATLKSY